jgi:hypothetical protein
MYYALWCAFIAGVLLVRSCGLGHGDCVANARTYAWVDSDADGEKDDTEEPLAGVRYRINDVLNNYTDVGNEAQSLSGGESNLSVWLPGCPNTEFEVIAEPPPGFRATTPSRVTAELNGTETLRFGFQKP